MMNCTKMSENILHQYRIFSKTTNQTSNYYSRSTELGVLQIFKYKKYILREIIMA